MAQKVRRTSDGLWMFECPGCGNAHGVTDSWKFNGNQDRPTFSPSVLVRGVKDAASDPTPTVCHSFVRDGQIQFLGDCTHSLAGKTVDLPDFD